MRVLEQLKPKKVYEFFEDISAIPHGSYHTDEISDWLVKFASDRNLRSIKDDANNVIIFKNASVGHEYADPIILQAHMDMVLAKTDDCTKNMVTEPVELRTDGKFVWAEKTSLGADNGIGLCEILAVLDDDTLIHPPIEAVLTSDEEVGMKGMRALDTSVLRSRKMINLDSGPEDMIVAGCAAGTEALITVPVKYESAATMSSIKVTVSGLTGGHSGVEIHKGRANANKLLGRILYSIIDLSRIKLVAYEGGTADNIITPYATTTFAVMPEDRETVLAKIEELKEGFRFEYQAVEPNMTVTVEDAEPADEAVTVEETTRIAKMMFLLPTGLLEMSRELDDLPQSSLNMGIVKLNGDFSIKYLIRSNKPSQGKMMTDQVVEIASMLGGKTELESAFNGWLFNPDSDLIEMAKGLFIDQYGKEPKISATHGGLETGLFFEQIPGIDIIALGPNGSGAHSPNEINDVESTERSYKLLTKIIEKLA